MRVAFACLALMLLAGIGHGADAEASDEYRRGVQSMSQPQEAREHFQLAVEAYRAAPAAHPRYFVNRSRAEYLAGQLPQAILTCRLGLTRDPGNLELRRQLAYLHERVPGSRSAADFEPLAGFPGMPSAGWSALGFGLAWTAAWCCAALAWTTMNHSWRNRAVACFLVASILGGLWVWHFVIRERQQREPLVVVARDFQLLHQGNGESYPAPPGMAPLRMGTEMRLLHRRGDWLKVRRADGVEGWVPLSAVASEAGER